MKNIISFIKFMWLQIIAVAICLIMISIAIQGCEKQSLTTTQIESKTKLPGITSIIYHGDTTIIEFKKMGNDLMWYNDGGTAMMYNVTITTDATCSYIALKKFKSWVLINDEFFTYCPKTCSWTLTN